MGKLSVALTLVVCGGAAIAAERPYEMVWANRTQDEFPSVARMENAKGWRIEAEHAVATATTDERQSLFGDGALKLTYRAVEGGMPRVRLVPEKPIAVGPFDTVSVWVYGNNICGFSDYSGEGGGRAVPVTRLRAEFRAKDGTPFSMDLGPVRHLEWFCQIAVATEAQRTLAASGSEFLGFTLLGGTNLGDESILLTSLCAYLDPKREVKFAPRPKRGVQVFPDAPQGMNTGDGRLPFPNNAKTVIPGDGRESPDLEFRLPAKPSESWDDLAFRWRKGEWIPFAKGGGVWPVAARKNARVTFHRVGDNVVAEIVVKGGAAEEVRFGGMEIAGAKSVSVPYYTYCEFRESSYRPEVIATSLGDEPFFILATMDWTQSAATAPIMRRVSAPPLVESNAGTQYLPRTDGRRNDVYERFVWSFSPDFAAVLPNIPNDPSPWLEEMGGLVRRHHGAGWAGSREKDTAYWRKVRRRGIRHLLVTDHEVGWRDGNESFTFRTVAAPKKGGDQAQYAYTRVMRDELGFRYGPYNNFTDFAPVNQYWSIDRVSRWPDGSLQHAWNRCYAPKPAWIVEAADETAPEIQRKFDFNTAYCDVHTCISPWDRCDFDARVPGAATFAATYYAFGELLLRQKATWKGPVNSEGDIHFMYAGLVDGNYAHDSHYGMSVNPWLVDFDLRRLHGLCANFGMGIPGQFYCWWRTMDDETDALTPARTRLDRFLTATLAFGHPGYLTEGGGYEFPACEEELLRSYYLVQGIARAYTRVAADEIRYGGAEGRLYSTSDAIQNGAYRRSQVFVRYADGTLVAANGSRTAKFTVKAFGDPMTLRPNGWCAVSGDGKRGSVSNGDGTNRVEVAWSDEYVFFNGCGNANPSGCGVRAAPTGLRSNGIVVLLAEENGVREAVVGAGATWVELPFAAKTVEGLDEARQTTGTVAFEVKDGVTRFAVRAGDVSYRVRR